MVAGFVAKEETEGVQLRVALVDAVDAAVALPAPALAVAVACVGVGRGAEAVADAQSVGWRDAVGVEEREGKREWDGRVVCVGEGREEGDVVVMEVEDQLELLQWVGCGVREVDRDAV
jgi:hypothetical protein